MKSDLVDALPPTALSGVDLPTATLELLATGIPRVFALPGWIGPTLFSSELSGGRLVSAAEPCPSLVGDPLATAWVVGSVRETMGRPTAHALFCLPADGTLWLVDVHAPFRRRYVNADLGAFLRSAALIVARWPSVVAAAETDIAAVSVELRASLRAIDPTALADDDHFWPTLIENTIAIG